MTRQNPTVSSLNFGRKVRLKSPALAAILGTLCLLTGPFFIGPAFALDSIQPAGEWQLVTEKEGIVLEQRKVVGSKLKETRGTVLIPATIDAVAAVLDDAAACPQWMHDCREGRQVEAISLGERVNYSVVDAPFFFDDRDLYVRSKIRYSAETGALSVQLTGDSTYAPEQKGRVRVLDVLASWLFEPTANGQIKATYQMYNNPQISVAGSVNENLAKTVFFTLLNLRKIAQTPKYANASFDPALKAAVSE